jgi:hypothetical protein
MLKIAAVSLTPFSLPASCWTAGCECQGLCSAINALGCVAVAGLATAGIFVGIYAFLAIQRLGGLRE